MTNTDWNQILADLNIKMPGSSYGKLQQRIEEEVHKARLDERLKERQELLAAYRLTAHNSGFGRQLKDNLSRNANRIAELQRKPRLVGITMPDGQVVRLHSSESELESGKSEE